MPRVIVCDVNETLLDVKFLEPHFTRAFGDGRALKEWFSTVLLYAGVATIAGPYTDFGSIAGAALDMTAEARGVALDAGDRSRILQGMRTLPAHPDVREGLQIMRDAGLRLVTLTNSAQAVVDEQLDKSGLAPFFDRAFSVDAVGRFKPAPETYQFVATTLGVPVAGLRLVAAHAWDVAGALRVGCAAAFVARPGQPRFPIGPQPDITAPDLAAAARLIVSAER